MVENSKPKATIVVIGTFRNGYQEVFTDYSKRVRRFLDSKGATVIRRQLVQQTLCGNLSPNPILREKHMKIREHSVSQGDDVQVFLLEERCGGNLPGREINYHH